MVGNTPVSGNGNIDKQVVVTSVSQSLIQDLRQIVDQARIFQFYNA